MRAQRAAAPRALPGTSSVPLTAEAGKVLSTRVHRAVSRHRASAKDRD